MSGLDELEARVRADVAEGIFTVGAQVVVHQGDQTLLDLALGQDGLGRPTSNTTRFRVYCTGKPVVALAVAKVVESGTLDLDQPLAPILPSYRCLEGGVTARHILTHTAGLHVPDGRTVELTAPSDRQRLLERQQRPGGWAVGRQAAYSEHLGWWVLGALLESITGEPLIDHIRSTVLEPLGLDTTTLGMTHDRYVELAPEMGVNLDLRALKAFPMLFERTERVCCEINPGHGMVTTATDLAAFYRKVLEALDGEQVPGLPGDEILGVFTADARPELYDEVLRRDCRYGLGFMTSLEGHAFGRGPGDHAFGHSGNVGSSFAFADPDRELSVAMVFNGVVDPESAFLRRRSLVDALYRDLDAMAADVAPALDPSDMPSRGGRWRLPRR